MLTAMEKEYGFKDPEYEEYKASILVLDSAATEEEIEELYAMWVGLKGFCAETPAIDPKLLAYDNRVAKQLDFLKSANLRVHIPLKGTPYFTDKALHAQGNGTSNNRFFKQ